MLNFIPGFVLNDYHVPKLLSSVQTCEVPVLHCWPDQVKFKTWIEYPL